MATIAPRISTNGFILTDNAGNHLIGSVAKEYTGPPAPTDLSYTVTTGALAWTGSASATSYKVYGSDPTAADPESLALLGTVTALTYAGAVLGADERRLYAVQAVDEYANVSSALSKPVAGMGELRRT